MYYLLGKIICKTMSKNKKYNLEGKLLVSNPLTSKESIFYKSVIYIVEHMSYGSIGLIINSPLTEFTTKLYVKSQDQEEEILSLDNIRASLGGPVDTEQAFILHSGKKSTKRANVSLSSDISVLRDIAAGTCNKKSLLILGYCGWDAGQLEQEIKDDSWFVIAADEQIIFADDNTNKWNHALDSLNINAFNFSSFIGNC